MKAVGGGINVFGVTDDVRTLPYLRFASLTSVEGCKDTTKQGSKEQSLALRYSRAKLAKSCPADSS